MNKLISSPFSNTSASPVTVDDATPLDINLENTQSVDNLKEAILAAAVSISAENLHNIAEQLQDGFILADETGKIVEWNKIEENITGRSKEDVLGSFIWLVTSQIELSGNIIDKNIFFENRKALYQDILQNGLCPPFDKSNEHEILRPDGTRRTIQITHFVIPSAKGFMPGCFTRDISELKNSLAIQEESTLQLGYQKQFISRILESIPSSLVVINRTMRVVSVNHNFLEKTRRDEQATLGHRLDEILPQVLLDYTHLSLQIQKIFRDSSSADGAKVAYHASGSPNRTYFYRLIPIFFSPNSARDKSPGPGDVENVMLLMDDMTEREQLGKEVRRIERHLAGVVECANDLVVSLDPQGKIVTWNLAAKVISGMNSQQAIGRKLVSVCSSAHQKVMTNMLGQLLQSGIVQHTEADLLTESGKEVPIAWNCSLMHDDSGNVAGIVAVGRDLTERRRMEDKLAKSADMASLGVMAGGIAHELRNPLGIISASAQLLMETPRDASLRKQGLNKIYAATRRASLIIENLLKFARPAGDWMKKEVDLHTIIDETLVLLASHITSNAVVVSVRYQPDLPQLAGSHEMLQQVFANLILNACNAMPDGGTLKIEVTTNSAGQVEISFTDSGHGISQENLSKIFDPFFTTMPVGKGVGLGLSISHTIIQQHHGNIDVHSELGKGSCFTVQLPRVFEIKDLNGK